MGKARTAGQKKRSRAGRPLPEPGRRELPENIRGVTGAFSLRAFPRAMNGPRIAAPTERTYSPHRDIERRLMTAMKTIRALPDKERRFFVVKGASLPYLQDYMDAYSSRDVRVVEFVPTPRDISDCLVALSWARHCDKRCWKVMWLRSFGFSFGLIAKYIGRSDETARRWFREGITDAWSAANGT